MTSWLNNLYSKSQLGFALAWIGAYCVGNSIAMSVSAAVGVEGLAELAVNALLSAVLFAWIRQRGLMRHYGLCRSSVTFGFGHILNLFNGSGMDVVSNVC